MKIIGDGVVRPRYCKKSKHKLNKFGIIMARDDIARKYALRI